MGKKSLSLLLAALAWATSSVWQPARLGPSVLSGSRCEDLRLFLLPAVAKGGGKGPLSSMLSQAVWGEGMKRDFQHV